MRLRKFWLALLMFSGVIIGISNFISDLTGKFGVNVDDLSKLSTVQQVEQKTKEFESSFRNTQMTGISFIDIPLAVLSGAYNLIKLITLGAIEAWIGFINSIASYLMLPSWFISIVIAAISICILAEALSAAMKYKI